MWEAGVQALSTAKTIGGTLVNAMRKFATEGLGPAWKALSKFISGLVTSGWQMLKNAGIATKNGVISLLNYAKAGWVAVGSIMKTVWAWVAQKAALIGNTIATHATTLATRIATSTQWTAVTGIMATVGAWIAQKAVLIATTTASYAAAAATKVVAAAQWLLNAALSANPIGIVIIAVAALVGGFILLYKKSETFRTAVNNLWKGFTGWLGVVGEKLKAFADKFQPIIDKVKAVGGWLAKLFGKKETISLETDTTGISAPTPAPLRFAPSAPLDVPWIPPPLQVGQPTFSADWIPGAFTPQITPEVQAPKASGGIIGFFKGIFGKKEQDQFKAAGQAIPEAIAEGIRQSKDLYTAMEETFDGVSPLLPHSDAKKGPLSKLTAAGRAIIAAMAAGVTKSPELADSLQKTFEDLGLRGPARVLTGMRRLGSAFSGFYKQLYDRLRVFEAGNIKRFKEDATSGLILVEKASGFAWDTIKRNWVNAEFIINKAMVGAKSNIPENRP